FLPGAGRPAETGLEGRHAWARPRSTPSSCATRSARGPTCSGACGRPTPLPCCGGWPPAPRCGASAAPPSGWPWGCLAGPPARALPPAAPADSPLLDTFRRLDHSAIYLLIAGTYTPIFAVLLHGRLRLVLLSVLWSLAAVGIACKWLVPWPPHTLTVGLYVAV